MIECDKPFTYNGEDITAGMNFIELGGIILSLDFHQDIVIDFSSDFINAASFIDEAYLFTLKASTDDGIIINSTLSLQIKI